MIRYLLFFCAAAGFAQITQGGVGEAATADSINALFGAHLATPQEATGTDIVTNGDFSAGLSGWTVSGDGTGWSIVGGKLHHTPGSNNKISTPVTVRQGNGYFMEIIVDSQTAGSAYFDLGADCNSDCSLNFTAGTNTYLTVAYADDGASVIEVQPDSDSDITISSVSVTSALPIISLPSLSSSGFALGGFALLSNTTGFNNSAIGFGALSSNTTGSNNSALGFASLSSDTTGFNNSAIGSKSLYSLTTGYNDTAIGYAALYESQSSHDLTAILTGAIGPGLMRGSQIEANNSVLIGPVRTTGTDSNSATALENIVALNGIATDSNQVVLGNAAMTQTFLFGVVNQPLYTPASSSETCTPGDHADDADYHYVCTAPNTWKRIALSGF